MQLLAGYATACTPDEKILFKNFDDVLSRYDQSGFESFGRSTTWLRMLPYFESVLHPSSCWAAIGLKSIRSRRLVETWHLKAHRVLSFIPLPRIVYSLSQDGPQEAYRASPRSQPRCLYLRNQTPMASSRRHITTAHRLLASLADPRPPVHLFIHPLHGQHALENLNTHHLVTDQMPRMASRRLLHQCFDKRPTRARHVRRHSPRTL